MAKAPFLAPRSEAVAGLSSPMCHRLLPRGSLTGPFWEHMHYPLLLPVKRGFPQLHVQTISGEVD